MVIGLYFWSSPLSKSNLQELKGLLEFLSEIDFDRFSKPGNLLMISSKDYMPMDEDQSKMLVGLVMAARKDKKGLDDDYEKEVKTKDFICQLVEKRIAAYKLPKFEPSAVMLISLLSKGNPGRAVVMMIEILEKYGEKETPVDVEFIATEAYPWGFYTDEAFERVWDKRKAKRDVGMNFLI